MSNIYRDVTLNQVSEQDIGKTIRVAGWVENIRDHGGVSFIDLRDMYAVMQIVIRDGKLLEGIRKEQAITVEGLIEKRDEETYNPKIPTGTIELDAKEVTVLGEVYSQLPFEVMTSKSVVHEDVRLKYRYLDLRNQKVKDNIIFRSKVIAYLREKMTEMGFLELQTPILCASSPEGARDYLVPSRVFNGNFFALPQSPQLYKQLTMLAGFDRYMQIAKCFRDEDLRADRQPEFTQIDFEMSFVSEDDVMNIAEGLVKHLYKQFLGIDIKLPLQRMSYDEAMRRFGSDKPDLRFGMEITDISDVLTKTDFRVFKDAIEKAGCVCAIVAKGLSDKMSRKDIDKFSNFVKDYGAKGLAFTKINNDGSVLSSYEKFLKDDEISAIRSKVSANANDVIFIVASEKTDIVLTSLGALRCELATRFDLIDKSKPCLLWINEFPLFEYNEDEDRFVAKHHPFTSPREQDINMIESDPGNVKARAYDLVLNGNEVGGGSVRINNPQMQKKMLKALGFSDEEAEERFGFLINAFKYGAPIHAGMAFGLDRLMMLLLDCDNIRDVIAFPKVASSAELMTEAPGVVDQKQLDELGLELISTEKK